MMIINSSYIGGAGQNPVVFDGSNDYIHKTSALTGVVDSNKFTFCCWLKMLEAEIVLLSGRTGANQNIVIEKVTSGWNIDAEDSTATVVLNTLSSTGVAPNNGTLAWLGISVDLSDTAKRFFYVNDTDTTGSITWSTYDTSGTIDLTNTSWHVLSDNGGQLKNAEVQHFWFAPGQYFDLSVEANRRKFITATGKPADLGSDGSTPTGTAPAIYFNGNSAAFPTNKGTGGAFTLVGALTDSTTVLDV